MAIFSRRTIQRMINENAESLTKEQLDQHVSRLNKGDFQSIDTEWEVAVLNIFSKIGKVEHEPNLGGSPKLDLLFVPHRNTEAHLIADVTTVNDEGFEIKNPLKAFDVDLKRRINKAGLRGNSFGYSVGAHLPPRYVNKPILMLPPRGEFDQEIFNSTFKAFVNRVKQSPDKRHNHHISTDKTCIHITYNPNQKWFRGASHIYNRAISKTQNPVYNALKLKAQKQFKRIRHSGPKGIILCDGGSDMVRTRLRNRFHIDYNAPNAIEEFLRQNQSIDFVLMLSSIWANDSRYQRYSRRPLLKIQVKIFPNTNFSKLQAGIRDSLLDLEKHFPKPINNATGARETIRHGFDLKKFGPLAGGFKMNKNQIKISANYVLGLLSGVVTQEELSKSPKLKHWDETRYFFKHFLNQKMRIVEIQVEDTEDDDSNLIFKFDGPDPAISPFINPKVKL